MVERRLGRGMDFFLSEDSTFDGGALEEVKQIEITALVPNPHQPRREFLIKELDELAQSIQSSGLLQPILARKAGDRYQIIAGERRWRAAKQIGLERIPTLVKEITDEQAAVYGLVENLHRADLNAIEKAKAFKKIQTLTKSSQDEVATKVGLDRSSVSNFIRLLDLPGEVQALVSRGTLSMGHARALLGLAGAQEQKTVAEEIARKKLSVRQVEVLVQQLKASTEPKQGDSASPDKKKPERPIWLKEIEDNLVDALNTSVAVRYGRKRSKITIECTGRDEFERVYSMLKALGHTEEL